MRSIESRFITGPSSILFGSVYGCAFEPGKFTGWGSEWVNVLCVWIVLIAVKSITPTPSPQPPPAEREYRLPSDLPVTCRRFEDEDQSVPTLVKEMVFGAGPRQCIGMRLALHEIRMVITFLIRKFKFITVRETPVS